MLYPVGFRERSDRTAMNRKPTISLDLTRETTIDGSDQLQKVYDRLIETAIKNLKKRHKNKMATVDNADVSNSSK